jgi:hypothetical protein
MAPTVPVLEQLLLKAGKRVVIIAIARILFRHGVLFRLVKDLVCRAGSGGEECSIADMCFLSRPGPYTLGGFRLCGIVRRLAS